MSGVQKQARNDKTPQILAVLDRAPRPGARDAALMLLGFASALRRFELLLRVRTSKTQMPQR